jgi:hypothetical protein
MPALARLRDTLTELTLSAAVCTHMDGSIVDFPVSVRGSAKPLAGFDQLKKLSVPVVFLTGWTFPAVLEALGGCLPRNVEDLTLTNDLFDNMWSDDMSMELDHWGAIREWLANVRTTTPRLRKLGFVLPVTEVELGVDVRYDPPFEIWKLARRAGIELDESRVY